VDVRLKRAIQSRTLPKELMICGPAGTGKTWGTLATLHCIARDYPDLRILICRQTRASLTESVLVTYEQEILPADGCEGIAAGVLRRVRQSYRYPGSRSEIVLGSLDEPARVMSTGWDIIYVNEALDTEEGAWEALSTRLNRPGRDPRFGWLLGDCNPGHPRHWIKLRADRGDLALWTTVHEANPTLFDGRDWTPAGREYLARLDKLSGFRFLRLRKGIWAAAEGLVYPDFMACIVEPANVPEGRLACGGIDFGFNNPFAAEWGWLDHDDVLWVVGERYERLVTLPEHSKAIPKGPRYWADPARPDSIAELRAAGHDVIPCVHLVGQGGARPILDGIDRVTDRIQTGRLRVSSACKDLVREAGLYAYDPEKVKEEPIDRDNHAMDALRYLIVGLDRGQAVAKRLTPAEREAEEQAQAVRKAEERKAAEAAYYDPDNDFWWTQ
jgi:hypothetical protein